MYHFKQCTVSYCTASVLPRILQSSASAHKPRWTNRQDRAVTSGMRHMTDPCWHGQQSASGTSEQWCIRMWARLCTPVYALFHCNGNLQSVEGMGCAQAITQKDIILLKPSMPRFFPAMSWLKLFTLFLTLLNILDYLNRQLVIMTFHKYWYKDHCFYHADNYILVL